MTNTIKLPNLALLVLLLLGTLGLKIHAAPAFQALPFADVAAVEGISVNMDTTTISTSAYSQLDAALDDNCVYVDVFNGGDYPILLALGAASSEVNVPYVFGPSGTVGVIPRVKLKGANIGKRLSAKSVGTENGAGHLIVNCYK